MADQPQKWDTPRNDTTRDDQAQRNTKRHDTTPFIQGEARQTRHGTARHDTTRHDTTSFIQGEARQTGRFHKPILSSKCTIIMTYKHANVFMLERYIPKNQISF